MVKTIKAKVSNSQIARLCAGETLRDTELKGFGVRLQKDTPTYFLHKRIRGRLRFITIGPHGAPWTPATARKKALSLLADIEAGVDPAEEGRKQRQKLTLSEAVVEFEEEHGPKLKPKTLYDYQAILKNHISPALGDRKIDDISRADVARLHTKLKGTPRLANLALSILSKIMNWAEEQGYRSASTNPCKNIRKFKEARRERFLSEEEFGRLGGVLENAANSGTQGAYVIAAIRLLILTGARLNEVLTLHWEYVDWERKVLRLPDSKTGQKVIVLSEAALDVLQGIPRVKGNPHVIVGHKSGLHLVNIQKPWEALRKLAGLDDVRLHDLRHSYASMAASSGASLPLIGRLLGHTQAQTTARYAHLADNPVFELNEAVGERLIRLMGGQRSRRAE